MSKKKKRTAKLVHRLPERNKQTNMTHRGATRSPRFPLVDSVARVIQKRNYVINSRVREGNLRHPDRYSPIHACSELLSNICARHIAVVPIDCSRMAGSSSPLFSPLGRRVLHRTSETRS